MKVVKTYVMPLLLVGGLLLNSVPTHAFFAYGVGIELDYSVTLNSKKDIRNFLLIACGLTLLGFGAYYFNKWIERSNNRPAAPRPSAPPAAKTPTQQLTDINDYVSQCYTSYDRAYTSISGVVQDNNPRAGELISLNPAEQSQQFFAVPVASLCDVAKDHFNAQKPSIVDCQEDLKQRIAKLNEYQSQFDYLQKSLPQDQLTRLTRNSDWLEKTKQRLTALQRFVVCRKPELELYQQEKRIAALYKEELTAVRGAPVGDETFAAMIRKRAHDRAAYKNDLEHDADQLGKAVAAVEALGPDKTQTSLYQEASDAYGRLNRIHSLAR